jgi:hypothetical protein
MILKAQANKWTASDAAAHLGFHRKSITSAAERFGVALPYHKFSPTVPSATRVRNRDSDPALTVRVKAWSASPAAIERALARV